MYIEFTGVSGSGKSTIANQILSKLKKEGYIFFSNHSHFFLWPFSFISLKNETIQNIFCDTVLSSPFTSNERVLFDFSKYLVKKYQPSLISRLNLLRSVRRKINLLNQTTSNEDLLYIIDEGIIHTAHNILIFENQKPLINEFNYFIEVIPLPNLIVYVDTPIETVLARTLSRKDQPIKGSKDKLKSYIHNAHEIYKEIFKSNRILEKTYILNGLNPQIDDVTGLIKKMLKEKNFNKYI
jgi:thymidylate kinase